MKTIRAPRTSGSTPWTAPSSRRKKNSPANASPKTIRLAVQVTRPALLCATSVSSVPLWLIILSKTNHRDTEDTELHRESDPSVSVVFHRDTHVITSVHAQDVFGRLTCQLDSSAHQEI